MIVHQVKIDFRITEEISRFVYAYILEGNSLYLIDSVYLDARKQSLII